MRVFKNKWFTRWARKESVSDNILFEAAQEIVAGKVEADLGGSLFKKRLPRSGGGKRGGYRIMSKILDIANEMAHDLFKAGVMDEITMREIKALCLPPQRSYKPKDIRRIRDANHVSQAAFAAMLGIGKTTVQQWEQGQKTPSGPARRLLDLVDRKGLAVLG